MRDESAVGSPPRSSVYGPFGIIPASGSPSHPDERRRFLLLIMPMRPCRVIIELAPQRFLLLAFLRRYVTYCARRGSFAAMNGAARLFAEL